jgi:hypothetical protein
MATIFRTTRKCLDELEFGCCNLRDCGGRLDDDRGYIAFHQDASLANGCGIATGAFGTLCGVTWTVAVMGK